jgi:hypothetical protein
MTNFQDVATICNMKTEYSELVSSMNISQSKRELTLETAKWFIESGSRFNSKSTNFKRVYYICAEYIRMESFINGYREE